MVRNAGNSWLADLVRAGAFQGDSMSGGSMSYLYSRVMEARHMIRHPLSPERRAFMNHLDKVADALKAIEWNDSGDGADNEVELIRSCVPDALIVDAAIEHAQQAVNELQYAIDRAKK